MSVFVAVLFATFWGLSLWAAYLVGYNDALIEDIDRTLTRIEKSLRGGAHD